MYLHSALTAQGVLICKFLAVSHLGLLSSAKHPGRPERKDAHTHRGMRILSGSNLKPNRYCAIRIDSVTKVMSTANRLSQFTTNAIEVMVLVTTPVDKWTPPCTLYRVTFKDGSEIGITASSKGRESLRPWEICRIYQINVPASCVKPVRESHKSGILTDKEIKICKAISWRLSTEVWPVRVQIRSLPFAELQQKGDTDVFDIVGIVVNDPAVDSQGKLAKKSVELENDDQVITMELLEGHAQAPLKKGDICAAHGVGLREWQGDRIVTTKHLSWIPTNPLGINGIVQPPARKEESPKKRALKMVSTDPISVAELQTLSAKMVENMESQTDGSAKIEAARCTVRVSFGDVNESFFDQNFVLEEQTHPRFLLSTSMSDSTGSIVHVKVWTKALCVILEKNPDEVLQAWQACENEDCKTAFMDNLNAGLAATWDCVITLSPWTSTAKGLRADVNILNVSAITK